MSISRGGFVIVSLTSLWAGGGQVLAQVAMPNAEGGGLSGGRMYLLRFADQVTVPPVEELRQVIDWLSPSALPNAPSRVERIDDVIKSFRTNWLPEKTNPEVKPAD